MLALATLRVKIYVRDSGSMDKATIVCESESQTYLDEFFNYYEHLVNNTKNFVLDFQILKSSKYDDFFVRKASFITSEMRFLYILTKLNQYIKSSQIPGDLKIINEYSFTFDADSYILSREKNLI